jgi:uncharacterized membrane protein YjgN (DUF898 family)
MNHGLVTPGRDTMMGLLVMLNVDAIGIRMQLHILLCSLISFVAMVYAKRKYPVDIVNLFVSGKWVVRYAHVSPPDIIYHQLIWIIVISVVQKEILAKGDLIHCHATIDALVKLL